MEELENKREEKIFEIKREKIDGVTIITSYNIEEILDFKDALDNYIYEFGFRF